MSERFVHVSYCVPYTLCTCSSLIPRLLWYGNGAGINSCNTIPVGTCNIDIVLSLISLLQYFGLVGLVGVAERGRVLLMLRERRMSCQSWRGGFGLPTFRSMLLRQLRRRERGEGGEREEGGGD